MDTTMWPVWEAYVLCCISATYTTLHWVFKVRHDSRSFDYCIRDIRALNTYNNYFMAAILVFLGLVLKEFGAVPKASLFLFLSAFISACFSLFFIPLEKPEKGEGVGRAKQLWLYTLIFSQFTVILTAAGVLSAVAIRYMLP